MANGQLKFRVLGDLRLSEEEKNDLHAFLPLGSSVRPRDEEEYFMGLHIFVPSLPCHLQ